MTDHDSLSEFLDGDSPDTVDLGGIPKDELARHLLVAGVTRHLLREAAGGTEDSVRIGMAAVLADGRVVHRRRNRILGRLAAAAAVIITTIVIFKPPPGFEPLLDRIKGFVTDDIDREYRVSFRLKGGSELPFHPQLFVRGTDRHALGFTVPFFGQDFSVWQGCDGTDHWLVVPDIANMLRPDAHTPIFVTSGSRDLWKNSELGMIRSIRTGVDQMGNALGIFDLLSELDRDYQIDKTPPTAAKIATSVDQIDITAFRNPLADIAIPDTIRMIVEEDTGVVRTIILTFVELPDTRGYESPFRGIRYDLVYESIVADDYYEHDAYHDPDRPVIRR